VATACKISFFGNVPFIKKIKNKKEQKQDE
jgi:hypothetical protein